VFNSPYAEFLGGLPAFEGVPVEQHLRNTRSTLQMPKVTLRASSLSPVCKPVRSPPRTTRECGIYPSFMDHFLSPRAKHYDSRTFLIALSDNGVWGAGAQLTKENPSAQYVTSARSANAETSYFAVADARRDAAVCRRVMDVGRAEGATQSFLTAVHNAPFGRTGLAMPFDSVSTGTLYSSELTRATRRREGEADPNLPDTAVGLLPFAVKRLHTLYLGLPLTSARFS
jgi:hypothetical protein